MSDAAYAAAIAPEIDRIRIAISHAIRAQFGPILAEFGITPSTGPVLGMLRNLAPDRRATRAAFDVVLIYQPRVETNAALDALADAGIVDLTPDDLGLTPRGVATVDRLYAANAEVVSQLWRGIELDFAALLAIARKTMAAAAQSSGPAYSVMAPMYEPPGTPEAVLFAESLTPLRFHRFDAHVAAWQAAGLTVEQVQALEDGPTKQAIEDDTNARAALPYAALRDDEREMLLNALLALPIVSA